MSELKDALEASMIKEMTRKAEAAMRERDFKEARRILLKMIENLESNRSKHENV